MERFIGSKVLLAVAMTRAQYCGYRGWELPANENGADEGYLVEYTDGGKPNMHGHAGYVSWSPKEQFELAYRPRPIVAGLAPHQQRVVDEQRELDDKRRALDAFLFSPKADVLGDEERDRMLAQADAMSVYSKILGMRIAAF